MKNTQIYSRKTANAGFTPIEILIVIAVIGLIGGLGYAAYNQFSNNEPQYTISTSEAIDTSLDQIDQILGLPEIQEIATTQGIDAQITGIELELDNGILLYIVHYTDGSSRVFNAVSGERLEYADNDNDEIDDSNVLPAGFVATVTIQQAIEIAQQQRPDSQIKKIEIELEDGVVVYSVRFTDDSRVDVRASDGVVQRLRDETGEDIIKLRDESEDDDTEDDDDDDSEGDDDTDGRAEDEDENEDEDDEQTDDEEDEVDSDDETDETDEEESDDDDETEDEEDETENE